MITRLHLRIYSLEELCYFICNNLYLIDDIFINRGLCDWIEDELELTSISDALREQMDEDAAATDLAVIILERSKIYALSEVNKMRNILEQLKNQKPLERQKFKADNLLNLGQSESAILIYQEMIDGDWDVSVPKEFYARIYASLGAAFGGQFLYAQAAKMYQEAYSLFKNDEFLKAYLYCCYRTLPRERYVKMLSGNSAFLTMNAVLQEELKAVKKNLDKNIESNWLRKEKQSVRNIDKKTSSVIN
jgi:tetratricopeptide (TPR) repeat protein